MKSGSFNQVLGFGIWSLLLALLPTFGAPPLGVPPCAENLSTLVAQDPVEDFGPQIKSFRVITVKPEEVAAKMGIHRDFKIGELTTEPGVRLKELETFGKPAALTIAFDTTGNTQGHMYLAVGGRSVSFRYDGRLFWRPQDVRQGDWRFSNGVILRYMEIPERHRKALEDLMDRLLKKEVVIKAPTCVASAWTVLYKYAGFQVGSKRGRPWFPSTLLRHLAGTGLLTETGERLIPEVYTLNTPYQDFWNNLPNWKRVWKFIIPVILNPATWGMRQFQQ